MGEVNINPLLNIHEGGKYKKMLVVNSYRRTDADATAIIDAMNADPAGVLSSVQESRIRRLVERYKAAGLWNKRAAMYCWAGDNAFKQKFNIRNLANNTNLGFQTGWTHSSNGGLPNGSTYATTNISQDLYGAGTYESFSMGYYSFTNSSSGSDFMEELGCRPNTGNTTNQVSLAIKHPSGSGAANQTVGSVGGSVVAVSAANAVTDTRGWFFLNRQNLSSLKVIQNTSTIVSSTSTETNTAINQNIIAGAMQTAGSINYRTNRGCSFIVIGKGLTDAEQAEEYSIIQEWQTDWGRNF